MGCSCYRKKIEEEELNVQYNKIKNENIINNKYGVENSNKDKLDKSKINENNTGKCVDDEKKRDKKIDININIKKNVVNNKNNIRKSINNENNIRKNFINKNVIEKNIIGKSKNDKNINDNNNIGKVINDEINNFEKIVTGEINNMEKNITDKKNSGKKMNDKNNTDSDKSISEKNDSYKSISDKISDESDELKIPDSELKDIEYVINKRGQMFFYVFGEEFKEKFILFFKSLNHLLKISHELETTFYTLSFGQVKDIIENLIQAKRINIPFINPKFYFLMVNNKKKYKKFEYMEDIFKRNDELSKILIEIQVEIIKYITIQCFYFSEIFKNESIRYSFIKFSQDIGFCIQFFYDSLCKFLYGERFLGFDYSHDIRLFYFAQRCMSLLSQPKFPQDLLNLATESVRIKDTIILGKNQFRNHIISLNIPSQRIHELDDNMVDSFFKKLYKENIKYKITKYFVICEEKNEKIYLEKFKSLSSKYGFAYLFLVYIKNKQISDMRIDLKAFNSVIYIFNDFELLEYFKDNNERLKPYLEKFLPENDEPTVDKLNDLIKFVYKDIEVFKSNCEDGWELFEHENNTHFSININIINFYGFVEQVLDSIIQSYKEHNSLEIFFKYYANYFCMALQPELIVNMTAYAKMFLYAYTLEEKDPHKNLYCILNDDLRSSNPSKINRHFDIIKLIGGLIKIKELKSYTGKVYRASYFKDELIKNIKIGLTITNSAFWSSTKKESVALKFLKKSNYKNGLIIAEGDLNNNVDIHLEEISRYRKEEEVLFLPFCKFKIKSFEKVNENNLSYYKLVLEKDSDSSIIEPFNKYDIDSLNFENKY